MIKKLLALILIFQFCLPVSAVERSGLSDPFKRSTSEYFFTRTGDEILKPVKLMGGVSQPGIYHIPRGTDLTTLLSLSGGALPEADVEKLKFTTLGEPTKEINLYSYMSERSTQEIKLNGGEIIYIPQKESWISGQTGNTIMVIVSVLSFAMSVYVVDRTIK